MDYTSQVQCGAALLDYRFPGWVNDIQLGKLDLKSTCNCILGQKFGDYATGGRETGLVWSRALRSFTATESMSLAAHGFDIPQDRKRSHLETRDRVDAEYAALTRAWADLICARRAEAQLAELEDESAPELALL